jgi:hypothetical protein
MYWLLNILLSCGMGAALAAGNIDVKNPAFYIIMVIYIIYGIVCYIEGHRDGKENNDD